MYRNLLTYLLASECGYKNN